MVKYFCHDCGKSISSSNYPYHNADHTISITGKTFKVTALNKKQSKPKTSNKRRGSITGEKYGKWFLSKNGNRCRYKYYNNKKIGIQWRTTKKTMIHGKMQKNSGFIFLNKKDPTWQNLRKQRQKKEWMKAKRQHRRRSKRNTFKKGGKYQREQDYHIQTEYHRSYH